MVVSRDALLRRRRAAAAAAPSSLAAAAASRPVGLRRGMVRWGCVQ
jgi:hypothetical protein